MSAIAKLCAANLSPAQCTEVHLQRAWLSMLLSTLFAFRRALLHLALCKDDGGGED